MGIIAKMEDNEMRNSSMHFTSVLTAIILSLLAGIGCETTYEPGIGQESDTDADGDGDGDGDADSDSDGDGDADSDSDSDGDGDGDSETCAEKEVDISINPVRMMILQDMSNSMQQGTTSDTDSKWVQAQAALTTMLENEDLAGIEFGFDVFPNQVSCNVTAGVISDTLVDNQAAIIDLFPDMVTFQGTPLLKGMNAFLDATYAPLFADGTTSAYLLIVSDGADTCALGTSTGTGATEAQLTTATESLLAAGIKTFAIGFDVSGDASGQAQLNAIAAAGGTDYTTFIEASDEASLTEALADIGATVASCEYTIEWSDEELATMDMDYVDVLIDGESALLAADGCETGGEGWTWVDDEHTTFLLCDSTCALLVNDSQISIAVGCLPPEVPE